MNELRINTTYHDLSNFYPPMPRSTFNELVENMKQFGWNSDYPILLVDGKIVVTQPTDLLIDYRDLRGFNLYVFKPDLANGALDVTVKHQSQVGVKDNHLIHPALAFNTKGQGIVTYTLTGDEYWPTHGYSTVDLKKGVGDINIITPGIGPLDDGRGY